MRLNIERYGVNGEGIALCENKVVFVPYALCGEDVECDVLKNNKSFCVAKINKIISKSECRIDPVCKYYKTCGGCNLMHANVEEQLNIKYQIVKNNLQKFANYYGEIKPIICSDKIYNYRNHITFAVSNNGKVGFFKNNSRDITCIKYCYLADENINKCIDIFNSYFFDNQISGYNYKNKRGLVKKIDIKYLNNQLLITIVSTTYNLPNLDHLCIRLNLLHIKYGLYISVNQDNNTLIYGKKLKHIFGLKNIENIENNITSYVSSYSFVQINNYIKSLIYEEIKRFVAGNVVVDAFAGRGVLSAMLCEKAKRVYAIEISQSCCDDANKMLKMNCISNMQVVCGDFEEKLFEIKEPVDCIVLDPPRKGVDEKALNKMLELLPQKLVYLSCSSDTLGRDLKVLMNKYTVVKVEPYDMFPNTTNIETLVFMEKK